MAPSGLEAGCGGSHRALLGGIIHGTAHRAVQESSLMGRAALVLCLYLHESLNGVAQARPPLTSLSSPPASLPAILLPLYTSSYSNTFSSIHSSIIPVFIYYLYSFSHPSIRPPICPSVLPSLPPSCFLPIHLSSIQPPVIHLKIFWLKQLSIYPVTCFPSVYLSLPYHLCSLFPPSLPPSFPSFRSSVSL